MNGAKIEERNYYAESYIALIEEIIKETASLIKDMLKDKAVIQRADLSKPQSRNHKRSNFRGCLNLLPLKLCKA